MCHYDEKKQLFYFLCVEDSRWRANRHAGAWIFPGGAVKRDSDRNLVDTARRQFNGALSPWKVSLQSICGDIDTTASEVEQMGAGVPGSMSPQQQSGLQRSELLHKNIIYYTALSNKFPIFTNDDCILEPVCIHGGDIAELGAKFEVTPYIFFKAKAEFFRHTIEKEVHTFKDALPLGKRQYIEWNSKYADRRRLQLDPTLQYQATLKWTWIGTTIDDVSLNTTSTHSSDAKPEINTTRKNEFSVSEGSGKRSLNSDLLTSIRENDVDAWKSLVKAFGLPDQ